MNEPSSRNDFVAANQKHPVIACHVLHDKDGVAIGVEYHLGDGSKHPLKGDDAIGLPEAIWVAANVPTKPAPKRKAKPKAA